MYQCCALPGWQVNHVVCHSVTALEWLIEYMGVQNVQMGNTIVAGV